ncbi:hypothetical protein [Methylopila sp. M107]|uniref:hypothetical protein n=1 Tax=Methylopila sp. M107 TaxID=1101190 RepID=UPI0004784620|nr:hypothetical protein [Methylopila sp. M107]
MAPDPERAAGPAVLDRDPARLPDELPRGAEIPDDLDPFGHGVLMRHQAKWLEDDSDLKLAEKGRRTGVTFAEALDHTLIAAARRSAGGQNCFYIGDTKDKGREFIGYVAHFAKVISKELVEIEEFLFEDVQEDGSTKNIAAFRARFASGFRVEALSSRPENIRGLQGVVCIDEAAYHKDVRAVIDAVNALLIWGGKIRVISTHNGVLNPFNELIREANAKKNPFSVHFIPFAKAVDNGLFRRVCAIRGRTWSPEAEAAWEAKIRGAYGPRTAAMRQELDAIPAEAEGAALTRVQIEAVMKPGTGSIVRWARDDAFKNLPQHLREAATMAFCEAQLKPVIDRLDWRRPHVFGCDFARKGDGSAYVVDEIGADLVRRRRLTLELRNVPYETQRDILFWLVERLPRMSGGALDATGNGAYLAEVASQKFGASIVAVSFSGNLWYRENMPGYVEAFADETIRLEPDEDVLKDHQALQYVGGVIKVPDDHRFKGLDGFDRHGDTAIAGALSYWVSTQDLPEYGYTPAREADPGYSPLLGANVAGGSFVDYGSRRMW